MPLEQASRKDLAAMCKKLHLAGYSRLRKDALIDHIKCNMHQKAAQERTQRHAEEIRQAMGGNSGLQLPSDLERFLNDILSENRPRQGYGVFMNADGLAITNLSTRATTNLSIQDLISVLQNTGRI